MPGYDGTGPRGEGTMTGRGLGYCTVDPDTGKVISPPHSTPQSQSISLPLGRGRGGRGRGGRRGRGGNGHGGPPGPGFGVRRGGIPRGPPGVQVTPVNPRTNTQQTTQEAYQEKIEDLKSEVEDLKDKLDKLLEE